MRPGGGFKVGRLAGVEIVINHTWLLVFVLVAVTFGDLLSSVEVDGVPFPGGPWPWLVGVATAGVFFCSLLAHELSHSVVARRNGIVINRITLFIFGGVAEMREDVGDPLVELKMAVAGPALTFLLSGVFYSSYRLSNHLGAGPVVVAPLYFLAVLNLFIGLFNLLPGFPLDGGRVLRALLWKKTGDLRRATRIASISGQVVAAALAALGVVMLAYRYWVSGVWFVLIGGFIFQLSRVSYRQTLIRLAATDTTVGDIMLTQVPVIDSLLGLSFVRDHYFTHYMFPAFPVAEDERLSGYLTRESLAGVSPPEWDVLTAGRIASPLDEEVAVAPDTPLEKVLRLLMGGSEFVFVVEGEEVLGILTREELLRYVESRLGSLK